ncbi:MAG: hypothetical protein WA085_13320 [Sphingobium sp.]
MSNKLITLDFTEYDTIEASKMLRQMAEDGKIVGMVFAVQLARQKNKRKVLLGATGRAANDVIVATGLSSVLHCNLTQQAMVETHD